jgi:tRNA(Ile)-lysidine synthase
MEFLSQNKVKSVCDSSNKDLRFLRNRIRHQLIPFLESGFNSNIEEILNRHAAVVGAENEWMNALVKPLFKAAVRTKKRSRLVLDLQIILSYPPAARRRVIREAILEVKGDLRRIGFNHIEAVMKIEGANDGLKVLHLPNRVRVEKEYENLSFEKISERKKSGRPCLEKTSTSFRYIVKRYGTTNIIELGKQLSIELHRSLLFSGEMKIGNNIAFFDGDKIDFPLLIRNIEPGDRFRPVGLFGTQKLKKYFIDHKVPKRDREVTPVIVCRDRIIWVAGHRIDESVKVDETTRRIVRMELSLDFEKENG